MSKPQKNSNKKPISLRSYAKRRGCTVEAVSKAISDGRLVESVVDVRGQPKIADPKLADAEWKDRTRARVDASGPPPDYYESRARREAAAAEREATEAALAAIELGEKRSELVLARDVESKLVNVFANCRNKLLGVPNRVRQRDPSLTSAQLAIVEDEIRDALTELADNRT